jgi:type I restriction enzyme S subunit
MKILRVNTDTHKRYWISNFSKLPIKLAPYHEQRVIADQIEELLSDLDNAIENIKKAKEQLEIYRLSILKEGFSGDLTKDWRKMYQDIKSGKEILVDITRQIKQPSLDLEDAAEIPEKWIYSSIVNLVAQEKNSLKRGPFGSSIKKSFFVPSGYKVYEQQNAIKNNCVLGRYYINKSKYEELEQFAVYPGDFIVSCAGTIGCIAEVPEGAEPGVINQALLKIKVNENILDKSFFLYQFKLYVEKFMRAKSRGSAMKNMSSVKELKQIPFVFTSIEEQRQIVSEIEARFSVCDKLEETIDNSLNQAESLRQSILKQAFEGKLTEQWRKEHKDLICGENSGESLLKKIKAEKEALEGKSRGRRKHD